MANDKAGFGLSTCTVGHDFTTIHIHHRTQTRGTGLAERAAQTIKRALKKNCESTQKPEEWDVAFPWITFRYNCSVQGATKFSPYHLLYARTPIIHPAQMERFAEPLDLHDPELASAAIIQRGRVAQEASIMAGNNSLIAQHRDKLRYATIRGGGYLPILRESQIGDFFYVKMPAKREVYRIKNVRSNGTVVLCKANVEPHWSTM